MRNFWPSLFQIWQITYSCLCSSRYTRQHDKLSKLISKLGVLSSSFPCYISTCKMTRFGSLFLNLNLPRRYIDLGFCPISASNQPRRSLNPWVLYGTKLLISSASGSDSSSVEVSTQLLDGTSESGCISDEATPSNRPLLPASSESNKFVPTATPPELFR